MVTIRAKCRLLESNTQWFQQETNRGDFSASPKVWFDDFSNTKSGPNLALKTVVFGAFGE
jgi:hypothetical protein